MTSSYYVLDSSCSNRMLFFSPPNPSLRDRWLAGQRFQKPPREPVVVKIQPGNEGGELLDYDGTSRLMSDRFYAAVREAGVDNLDVYEAVVESQDGSMSQRGFKVFNLLGIVRAADVEKTVFSDPSGSRLIDASIDSLAIDPLKAKGLLMFRLAEYVGAVIVHERVKRVIESKKFPHIVFREPSQFISL